MNNEKPLYVTVRTAHNGVRSILGSFDGVLPRNPDGTYRPFDVDTLTIMKCVPLDEEDMKPLKKPEGGDK